MVKKIDARGLACPKPVLLAKTALEELKKGMVEITVDDRAAFENICRLAKTLGCETRVKKGKKEWVVEIEKGKSDTVGMNKETSREMREERIIFIKADTVGEEGELGKILMKVLFPVLLEVEPKPDKLVFMNRGVILTVEGSPVLESLLKLEKMGVKILTCGTCLDYFELKDKVKVGEISNFFDIAGILLRAGKVITL